MKYYSTLLPLLILLVFNLSNCGPKPIDSSMAALQAAKESQENSLKTLELISAQADKAAKEGTIAESANQEIQEFVASENARIKANQQTLEEAKKEAEDFKAKRTKKSQKEVVAKMNEAVVTSTSDVRLLDKKTEVVVDFLGNFTFSKSEIGALFRPGEYHLIKEQIVEGEKLFRPIVEKLFGFADKHKDSYKKLKGEIIVTGYSDATQVERGSRLYKDLVNRIQTENESEEEPTGPELNRKLSELRALAVKQLLSKIIAQKNQQSGEQLEITLNVVGRGEELPKGLPANISKNDPRRRVVTFYWVVLPKL